MEHGPSGEVYNRTAGKKIRHLVRNPNFHKYVYRSPPLLPILSEIFLLTSGCLIPLRHILIQHFHLRLDQPTWLLSSGSPTKIPFAFLATCPSIASTLSLSS
jgi:hypothetical protein